MNIALLGYGKMGKTIEKIAQERNHTVVLKTTSSDDTIDLTKADVAIDFSIPSAAYVNIKTCIEQNTPVISGTTGWLHNYEDIVKLCNAKNGTFLYASNFSLGVNIFFELNKKLSQLMAKRSDYKVSLEEIHHTQKLDAPSGTAITIANTIIGQTDYNNWTLKKPALSEIKINAKRIENVPGTHSVTYDSKIDSIEIKHTAHNRKGFALGAIVAAEWIATKKGVFTMNDVLNIG
ncbi:4-hydroxy-tetrahydrodipicolinate reductase [Ichthyenterobacterium sp. W332]|uniref:4-hydroxy-tetrahydrodipicolinate reductase n=1 Tax=Microcosmobacter mediterraneus TaxID=3075607 RepID=A0ABU2YHB9_9FLAO|nr:4-hydroxy-tetrahydrodipicolinate reductase [Ichthyenterobacterium sp. W332]MDT0557207.1 4-hydroxy-tetrahydrodipicolinate reductase [Ichthyenterobacterium sp. W332]